MRNTFAVAAKEMRSFFYSGAGVLVFFFFYVMAGIFFSLSVLSYARLSMESLKEGYQAVEGLGLTRFVFSGLFLNLGAVLLFLAPVMTMRSLAEERKLQTLELLYTYPLSDFDIVFGKFLGLVWIFELLFLPTAGYLWILHSLGGVFDWGPILTAYLGFWLLGGAFLSLGLFISSLTENQVVSAVVTFAVLLILWMLEWISDAVGGSAAGFIRALSPFAHYRDFTLGILDLSHAAYFVLFHFFFLFLTMRSVETRHWKS
ncbi:MAG: ABC transporter permease [Candidatus Omnitrophica bacterium]|nr:ABC transporter permease [Candidatus Omnitrophota bacterium]